MNCYIATICNHQRTFRLDLKRPKIGRSATTSFFFGGTVHKRRQSRQAHQENGHIFIVNDSKGHACCMQTGMLTLSKSVSALLQTPIVCRGCLVSLGLKKSMKASQCLYVGGGRGRAAQRPCAGYVTPIKPINDQPHQVFRFHRRCMIGYHQMQSAAAAAAIRGGCCRLHSDAQFATR